MKKLFVAAIAICLMGGATFAQETSTKEATTKVSEKKAEFKFEEEVFDFGNVVEGEKARHEFQFTNTGDAPLIISSVSASCGCTTPEWPREPIMPGESSMITAIYNSKGRPNAFNKAITIQSNAATPRKVLYIKGNVVKEENVLPLQKKAGPIDQ